MDTIKKDTIIRTVVLLLALVNNALTLSGKSPLPIEDDAVVQLLTNLFTMAAALWAWWKNNSFTKNAIKVDQALAALNSGETEVTIE